MIFRMNREPWIKHGRRKNFVKTPNVLSIFREQFENKTKGYCDNLIFQVPNNNDF